MQEIVSTKVMSRKVGDAIWLDGGKLDRANFKKGDTLTIVPVNDKLFKLVRSADSLPRSTETTQNISGKKQPNREMPRPIIELPIRKANVQWGAETCLKITITPDCIIIQINDYAERQRQRKAKFEKAITQQAASLLDVMVDDLPRTPHRNHTCEADLGVLTFDENADKSAKFYNALMSLEKANPFAIMINNFDSKQNTIQDGLLAVLRRQHYRIHVAGDRFLALGADIEVEDVQSMTKAVSQRGLRNAFGLEHGENVQPTFGNQLGDKRARRSTIQRDLKNGTLSMVSLFHGGGTVEYASADLLRENDLAPALRLCSEINDDYLQHSFELNNHAFCEDTIVLNGDISSFEASETQPLNVSLFLAGIVCKGGSRSGRSVLKLANAEAHPTAGHLFWDTMKFFAEINPSIIVIENTDSYRSTASYDGLVEVIRALNYDIEDGILNANDFGTTETRKRLFLVASNERCEHGLFSKQHHFHGPRKAVSMMIDTSIQDDHPSYREYAGLKEKERRDIANGKGFRRPLYYGEETRTLLIRQSYVKAGSTDPCFVNPSNPEMSRLFTPMEHAQLKGFPVDYVAKGSNSGATVQHSILGQGWTWHIANQVLGHVIKLVKTCANATDATASKLSPEASGHSMAKQFSFDFAA